MTYSSKAAVVISAIALGALAVQFLDTAESRPPVALAAAEEPRDAEKPEGAVPKARGKSSPNRVDAPLQHAILRDEKHDDSAEAHIFKALDTPTVVEFIDLPFEEAINYLKEIRQINMII